MPSESTLAVFAVVALTMLVIPGPSVLYIATRSAVGGTRAGFVSMLGIHAGTSVHILGAIVGLSAILAASARVYSVVQLAGAAYLVYLGLRALRSRTTEAAEERIQVRSTRRLFWQGFAVETLNPKTAVFFLAFFPQFVEPSTGPVWSQSLLLGVVFVMLASMSDGAYVLAASWTGSRLRARTALRSQLRQFEGGVLLTLGLGGLVGLARSHRA